MKSAAEKTQDLQQRLARRGIQLDFDTVNTLRRAELTLHRWAEAECGNSNEYQSWSIERDDSTGKPYMVCHPHTSGKTRRYSIPDREAGALRRVIAICREHGLNFYHQGDPRGCVLYVDCKPIADNAYTNAVACCA